MPYLMAAFTLVAIICVLNLVLTLGVIRRLRHHSELLAPSGSAPEHPSGPDIPVLEVGRRPAPFEVTTYDGATLTLDDLAGEALLGFFSPSCPSCRERVPEFLARHLERPADSGPAVAVITGHDQDSDDMAASLAEHVIVVRQAPGGQLLNAFGVAGYPMVLLLGRDGTVAASGFDFTDFPAAGPVPIG
jgi:hypothetical protein